MIRKKQQTEQNFWKPSATLMAVALTFIGAIFAPAAAPTVFSSDRDCTRLTSFLTQRSSHLKNTKNRPNLLEAFRYTDGCRAPFHRRDIRAGCHPHRLFQ